MSILVRYPAVELRVVWIREDASGAAPLTRGQKQYRRMRERMAADPEYRERVLAAARVRTGRYRERNAESLAPVRRANQRAWYADNRERISAKRRRAYTGTTADRIRAQNRDSHARNRDERNARRRQRRQDNLEDVRAKEREARRRAYVANPRKYLDAYKAWRLANLERGRAYVRVSNNKRRGAPGTFTFQEWFALLAAYDGCCAYCGGTEHIEADHRTPIHRGGSNTIENILPACRRCNRRKHTMTEGEFRALLAREAALRAALSEKEQDPPAAGSAG